MKTIKLTGEWMGRLDRAMANQAHDDAELSRVRVESRVALPLCELIPAEKHQCECVRCLYGIE